MERLVKMRADVSFDCETDFDKDEVLGIVENGFKLYDTQIWVRLVSSNEGRSIFNIDVTSKADAVVLSDPATWWEPEVYEVCGGIDEDAFDKELFDVTYELGLNGDLIEDNCSIKNYSIDFE